LHEAEEKSIHPKAIITIENMRNLFMIFFCKITNFVEYKKYIFTFIIIIMSNIHINPEIHYSWRELLYEEFQQSYFHNLKQFLVSEKKTHTIYPPGSQIFNAFNLTHFNNVKVVILGQDPYHNKGQAHGLSFSVPSGTAIPPSLQNIFKEISNDIGCKISTSGNLTSWAEQGVLLLNATLTVRANEAGSHQKQGWELFTDKVIQLISNKHNKIVFMLWGNYAKAKRNLINTSKHLVLEAAHPSPFSAYNGFLGCRHFSQCNEFLKENSKRTIEWCISNE